MSAIEKKPSEKKKEMPPINPSDDAMMVREGLRNPLFVQNPEWHRKTLPERAAMSNMWKPKGYRASSPGKTRRTVQHRLVVHLKNLQKEVNFKTTYSEQLYKDQILGYLHSNFDRMLEEILVIYFDGKVFPFNTTKKS